MREDQVRIPRPKIGERLAQARHSPDAGRGNLRALREYPSAAAKKRQSSIEGCRFYFFTLHFSLKPLVDFWQVISNSE